jgi:hypothetical protein
MAAVILSLGYHADVPGLFAYALERGKLQADVDHPNPARLGFHSFHHRRQEDVPAALHRRSQDLIFFWVISGRLGKQDIENHRAARTGS